MTERNIPIESVRSNSELCELLWKLDVEIGEHVTEDWYKIKTTSFDSFGADGSGGRFILLPDARILYISSEGSAGTLANNLLEFFDLLSGAPYWSDILHFSKGGVLSYMQEVESLRRDDESNGEDWPQSMIARFREILALGPTKEGYAAILHSRVKDGEGNPTVTAPDGSPYESLFGNFKPSDNPTWRNA